MNTVCVTAFIAASLGLCGLAAGQREPIADEPFDLDVVWFSKAGAAETSLDVVFVGEGYEKGKGKSKFKKDLKRYGKRLLETLPFESFKKRINVLGAFVPSRDSGCEQASDEDAVDTLLDACFDSREGRALSFRNGEALTRVMQELAAELEVEVEHLDIAVVMVNTERYGGTGTTLPQLRVRGRAMPAPTFAAQDTSSFLIAVHELGHSFAQLSDEYADESQHRMFPLPEEGDVPSANATLPRLVDDTSFDTLRATLKWSHFLEQKGARSFRWIHSGGFYRETGIYRPWEICLMRTLDKDFCPVCAEEVSRAIVAACGDSWDDVAWHKQHPLRLWKGKH